jgi:hypothetical protein
MAWGALRLCLRGAARRRWTGTVVVVLLIAGLGGLALVAAGAARRTSTVIDRLARATAAADLTVVDADESGQGGVVDLDRVARADGIAAAARSAAFAPFSVESSSGPLPGFVIAPVDRAAAHSIERPLVLRGRSARPDRIDEVTISRDVATGAGVDVGDRLTFCLQTPAELDAFFSTGEQGCSLFQEVRVVGIDVFVDEFGPRAVDAGLGRINATRAFARQWAGPAAHGELLALQLEREGGSGAAARRSIDAAVEAALEPGSVPEVAALDDELARVDDTVRPLVFSLLVLAGLSGLAAIVIGGQAVARRVRSGGADDPALNALGVTPRNLIVVAVARAAVVVVPGSLVAVAIAIVLSGIAPVGRVRYAEPDPGVRLDPLVVGVGGIALAVALLGVAAVVAWRKGRSRDIGPAPSAVAGWAAAQGLSAPAVTGVRLALDGGGRPARVPVRSTLVSSVVGAAAITAAVVVAADLQHLLDTPRLYGYGWDVSLGDGYGPPLPEGFVEIVAEQDGTSGVAAGGIYALDVDGEEVGALGVDVVAGEIGPSVIAGGAPDRDDEILLGNEIADDLGVDIGATVKVSGTGDEALRFSVVGRGTLPEVNAIDELDRGAAMTFGALRRLVPEVSRNVVVARLEDGTELRTFLDDLGEALAPLASELTVAEEELRRIPAEEVSPREPVDLVDLASIDRMPQLTAACAGVIALAMFGHLLVSSVSARRRDLALLRVLGFERRQIRATVAWQATTIVTVSLGVGVPLGVIAGQWLWRAYADQVGVVPEVVTPVLTLAVSIAAVVAIAYLVAAAPAWGAARAKPAVVLRTE